MRRLGRGFGFGGWSGWRKGEEGAERREGAEKGRGKLAGWSIFGSSGRGRGEKRKDGFCAFAEDSRWGNLQSPVPKGETFRGRNSRHPNPLHSKSSPSWLQHYPRSAADPTRYASGPRAETWRRFVRRGLGLGVERGRAATRARAYSGRSGKGR